MKKPKLRELGEAIKAIVSGPYTVKFPKGPSVSFERFRGKPEFDEQKCVGCGACVNVCPPEALELKDTASEVSGVRRIDLDLGACIFCGQCEENCLTNDGIHLTNEYDLATLDRQEIFEYIEKELLLCEICRAIIGPVDHVRWLARKLGPAAFSNPTLMLTALGDLGLAEEEAPKADEPVGRPDRIRVLCPKCRRVTTLDAS